MPRHLRLYRAVCHEPLLQGYRQGCLTGTSRVTGRHGPRENRASLVGLRQLHAGRRHLCLGVWLPPMCDCRHSAGEGGEQTTDQLRVIVQLQLTQVQWEQQLRIAGADRRQRGTTIPCGYVQVLGAGKGWHAHTKLPTSGTVTGGKRCSVAPVRWVAGTLGQGRATGQGVCGMEAGL